MTNKSTLSEEEIAEIWDHWKSADGKKWRRSLLRTRKKRSKKRSKPRPRLRGQELLKAQFAYRKGRLTMERKRERDVCGPNVEELQVVSLDQLMLRAERVAASLERD